MPSARDVRAGGAFVEIGIRERVRRGLIAIQARLRAMSGFVTRLSRTFALLGTGISIALIGATKAFADMGDQIHKMSIRTGVGAESLSRLGFAAEQSGSDLATVGKALFRIRRSIGEAALTPTSQLAMSFKELGLSVEELQRLSPEEQFIKIAGALNDLGDEARAAYLGNRILGRGMEALFPLIREGEDGLRRLGDQAARAGKIYTAETAQAAADFTDAMNFLKTAIAGVVIAIGSTFAPSLTKSTNSMAEAAGAAANWAKENKAVLLVIAAAPAALFALSIGLKAAGLAFSLSATAIGLVSTAVTIMTGIVTTAIGIIGGMTTAVGLLQAAALGIVGVLGYTIVKAVATSDAFDGLGATFNKVGSTFKTAWAGIKDAIDANDLELAMKIAATALELVWSHLAQKLRAIWFEMINDVTNALLDLERETKILLSRINPINQGFLAVSGGTSRGSIKDETQPFRLPRGEKERFDAEQKELQEQLEALRKVAAVKKAIKKIEDEQQKGELGGLDLPTVAGSLRRVIAGSAAAAARGVRKAQELVQGREARGQFGAGRAGGAFAFGSRLEEKQVDLAEKQLTELEKIRAGQEELFRFQ